MISKYLIKEFPEKAPFVIGIWCGEGKPPLNEYLNPFVLELKELLLNGLKINENFVEIHFGRCICDTPARSYIKGSNQKLIIHM